MRPVPRGRKVKLVRLARKEKPARKGPRATRARRGRRGPAGKDGETQDLSAYATTAYVDEKFDSLQSLEGVSF